MMLSLYHIPYFLQSGTGIIIKSRNELASHVLPTYFNTQDFASFHRQLTNCKYTISFCTQLLHPLHRKVQDFVIFIKTTELCREYNLASSDMFA